MISRTYPLDEAIVYGMTELLELKLDYVPWACF
jgi:hypothetical protein